MPLFYINFENVENRPAEVGSRQKPGNQQRPHNELQQKGFFFVSQFEINFWFMMSIFFN